jgi:hypothetical protein
MVADRHCVSRAGVRKSRKLVDEYIDVVIRRGFFICSPRVDSGSQEMAPPVSSTVATSRCSHKFPPAPSTIDTLLARINVKSTRLLRLSPGGSDVGLPWRTIVSNILSLDRRHEGLQFESTKNNPFSRPRVWIYLVMNCNLVVARAPPPLSLRDHPCSPPQGRFLIPGLNGR